MGKCPGNQSIQNCTDTYKRLKRHKRETTTVEPDKPLRWGCRSPWILAIKSLQLRKKGCKETLHCHLGPSDSGSNQTQRRQVVNREHTSGQTTPWKEANVATAYITSQQHHQKARRARVWVPGGCRGGWRCRARARPRPAAPQLCSALHRGDRRSQHHRKGRARGPLLPENCVGDPPPGIEAGVPERPRLEAGWGVFQKPAKAPNHQGFPSSSGPLAPRDTRYTTCQVRGGGVPGRRQRRAQGRSSPLLPPPGSRGRGRAERRRASGQAAAEGRPARTRGRQRGAHRLRTGRWQGLGSAAAPGWASAAPAAALWKNGGLLAARRPVFSYKPRWQARRRRQRRRRRRRRNLPASRATSARRPAHRTPGASGLARAGQQGGRSARARVPSGQALGGGRGTRGPELGWDLGSARGQGGSVRRKEGGARAPALGAVGRGRRGRGRGRRIARVAGPVPAAGVQPNRSGSRAAPHSAIHLRVWSQLEPPAFSPK